MFRYELTRRISYCLNHQPGHQRDRVPDGYWDSIFTVNDIILCNSSVFQCLYIYESYSNSQKFLCESSKVHLSFELFFYLLISMNSAVAKLLDSLSPKHCLYFSKCMSFIKPFPWPRMYFPSLSNQILIVLWGTLRPISSSVKTCMYPCHSMKGFTHVILLSHEFLPQFLSDISCSFVVIIIVIAVTLFP